MNTRAMSIWVKRGLIGLSLISAIAGWWELIFGRPELAVEAFFLSLLFCPILTHVFDEIFIAQEVIREQRENLKKEMELYPEKFDKLDRFDSEKFFNPNSHI